MSQTRSGHRSRRHRRHSLCSFGRQCRSPRRSEGPARSLRRRSRRRSCTRLRSTACQTHSPHRPDRWHRRRRDRCRRRSRRSSSSHQRGRRHCSRRGLARSPWRAGRLHTGSSSTPGHRRTGTPGSNCRRSTGRRSRRSRRRTGRRRHRAGRRSGCTTLPGFPTWRSPGSRSTPRGRTGFRSTSGQSRNQRPVGTRPRATPPPRPRAQSGRTRRRGTPSPRCTSSPPRSARRRTAPGPQSTSAVQAMHDPCRLTPRPDSRRLSSRSRSGTGPRSRRCRRCSPREPCRPGTNGRDRPDRRTPPRSSSHQPHTRRRNSDCRAHSPRRRCRRWWPPRALPCPGQRSAGARCNRARATASRGPTLGGSRG
jgi:hypothetical protein